MSEVTDDTATDTTSSNGGDLATTDQANLAAFNEHVAALAVEDDEVVQERILRNLLRATSPDDILRAGEALPAAMLLDVPLRILSIRASESSFEEGADYYLHVDAVVVSNGDHVTFSCGASDVAMKLIRMDQLSMFPVTCVMQRAKKATKAGFFPIFLRPVDSDGAPF